MLDAMQTIDEIKNQVCTIQPSLQGWCSKEKALTLIDIVTELNPKVCVDIGTFGGSSLFPVACALKFLESGVVIGIDPWDKLECIKYYDPVKDEENLRWWMQLDLDAIYNSYLKEIKRFGLEGYCITMRMTSERAATSIEEIDLLHIDGNHNEQNMTQDAVLYLPKVRSGGYILLNDSLWDDAQKAVDILLKECDVIKLIDCGNCIVFKKR